MTLFVFLFFAQIVLRQSFYSFFSSTWGHLVVSCYRLRVAKSVWSTSLTVMMTFIYIFRTSWLLLIQGLFRRPVNNFRFVCEPCFSLAPSHSTASFRLRWAGRQPPPELCTWTASLTFPHTMEPGHQNRVLRDYCMNMAQEMQHLGISG